MYSRSCVPQYGMLPFLSSEVCLIGWGQSVLLFNLATLGPAATPKHWQLSTYHMVACFVFSLISMPVANSMGYYMQFSA